MRSRHVLLLLFLCVLLLERRHCVALLGTLLRVALVFAWIRPIRRFLLQSSAVTRPLSALHTLLVLLRHGSPVHEIILEQHVLLQLELGLHLRIGVVQQLINGQRAFLVVLRKSIRRHGWKERHRNGRRIHRLDFVAWIRRERREGRRRGI